MNDFNTHPSLHGPVPLSHVFMRHFIQAGDQAVDATCGNGRDTLLLAELVGDNGVVWAFDIQSDAIAATAQRLNDASLANRVRLICDGHENMAEHVPAAVSIVAFNLGYLPGGDHSVMTSPETTLAALKQALTLLKPRGMAVIAIYPGHAGGLDESIAVESWTAGLDPHSFHSWRMGQMNALDGAPYLILIQKAA